MRNINENKSISLTTASKFLHLDSLGQRKMQVLSTLETYSCFGDRRRSYGISKIKENHLVLCGGKSPALLTRLVSGEDLEYCKVLRSLKDSKSS